MKPRLQFWGGMLFVVLIAAAALIPGSPIYFPEWLVSGGYYDGRSTRAWVRCLDSPDANLRREAIFALGAIGPPARAAVPALAEILRGDSDPRARELAALGLFKMAPVSGSAVPALADAV